MIYEFDLWKNNLEVLKYFMMSKIYSLSAAICDKKLKMKSR